MQRASVGTTKRDLEEVVARFETAWIVQGEAEIAGYLPRPGHPDRHAALLDLVRMDMVQRCSAGRPRRVEEYLEDYPELNDGDVEELALAEYRLRLESGDRPSLEEYRARFHLEPIGWPEAGDSDGGGLSILRASMIDVTVSRKTPDLAEAARSYLDFRVDNPDVSPPAIGAWAGPPGDAETVEVFVDLHQSDPREAERLAHGVVRLPKPGETFLGFRLLGELGRGAFGRVYLASQGDLADRPVALKVSAEKMIESQTLAQLQHTNIVPIFSAHRVDPLHAVCMPYFGSTTLKDVLEELEDRPSMPTSGRGIVDTMASRRGGDHPSSRDTREVCPLAPSSAPPGGDGARLAGSVGVAGEPARPAWLSSDALTMLGRLSYVEAILWIGARLADGLAHAHGRGILHRDLKPANILLTDSGQPMLLDFNLSADAKLPASLASIGGTLPYMAPEHLKAFRGEDLAVDARSDIYALGLIFYELLTGRRPFEAFSGSSLSVLDRMIDQRSDAPADLRVRNPHVSPAVESMVRHCLDPDPLRRYQSANDLCEDLARHAANLPLRHAPEPSLRERAAKWARRHPRLASTTSVAILIGALALGLFAGSVAGARRMAKLEADAASQQFRDDASVVRYLLNTRIFDRDRRARAVALARECLGRYKVLDDRAWQAGPLVSDLDPKDRRTLLEEAGAVLLFLAQAGQLDAEGFKPDDPARRAELEAATRLCHLAGDCFEADRKPRSLLEQEAELARRLGHADVAARLQVEAGRITPRTALDCEMAATSLTIQGQFRKALPLASEATRLDPRDFWAWFTLGLCHERIAQDAEATACFGTCIALRPDSPFGWFNRGVVHLRRADYDQARRDLDRASELDPNWTDPYIERAIAENLAGKPNEAVRDFSKAIEMGSTETRIYFLRAQAREKAGDAQGARADRDEGLRREPRDDLGWVVRAMSRQAVDPAAALVDLDRALVANPRSLDALQNKAYVLAERLGRIEDAEVVLDRAVATYPDFVPSRSARGVMRALLGRRESAHIDARESLWRDTTPRILYQVAGIYAVTSKQVPEDKVEAYRLLSTALRNGYGFEELGEDRELDAIRDQPEFRKLLEAAQAIRVADPVARPGP